MYEPFASLTLLRVAMGIQILISWHEYRMIFHNISMTQTKQLKLLTTQYLLTKIFVHFEHAKEQYLWYLCSLLVMESVPFRRM